MEQPLELGNQQERREAAIRLGSFFEGEGTFIVSVYTRGKCLQMTPVIRMGNCDPDTIREMSRILKMHDVGHRIYQQKKYSERHAVVGVLGVEGYKRVNKFLAAFGDFFFGRKRANVKLFRKYLPVLAYTHDQSPEAMERRRGLVEEFRQANRELNRLGVSRFLIDYTPDALLAKI